MNPAQLNMIDSDSSPFFRRIKVCCHVDLPPTQIIASRRLMSLFTSIHVETVEMDFFDTVVSSYRLAVDNPFLADADRSNLDERGLIRPGTQIEGETLLASVLGVLKPRPGVAKTSPGMQRVRDESLRAPFGWGGAVVTSSEFLHAGELEAGTPKNVRGRVRIELKAERVLTPGDMLFVAPSMKPLAPVARFAELADGVDLLVGLVVGLRLHLQPNLPCDCLISKGEVLANDVLRARSIGPYSLISKQPLSGRCGCPGQPFSAENAQWLSSHRLLGILTEVTAINCEQDAHATAFAPYTLHVLASHLQAMALNVQFGSEGDHVSLRLKPSADEELISRSSGEIKKPETINYRTYKPERGGLFCEEVYGPEDSVFRDRRFGHLKLPVEIVPFFYRAGSSSLLERILNISTRELNALIEYEAYLIPEPNGFRIAEIDQKSLPSLSQTGASALRTLLAAVPEAILPAGLRGRTTSLMTRTLLVLPPDLRPLVLLENGNFATSDLNDLYRRVINRANRLRKLLEMKAPDIIIFSECRFLQHAVDSLFCNQFLKSVYRVNGSQNRPLVDLSDLVASTFLDKNRKLEDFSARARVVMDTGSLPGTALIPRNVFSTLELDRDVPVILANADGISGIVAAMPVAHDDPVIRLPEGMFVQLRFLRSVDPQCLIFRIRTAAGIADARRLISDPIDLDAPNVEPSPIDVESHAELINVLVAHISSGNPLHLNSATGLLIGGSGSIEFAPPTTRSAAAIETREVAIPPGSTATELD